MIDKKIIKWSTLNAVLMVSGMIAALWGYRFVFPALAVISFGLYFILMEKTIRTLKPFYGPGNWVTLLRLAGLIFLLTNYRNMTGFSIGILAYLLVALDGIDGFAARKTNTTSEFGAWFDMETDAFYVALMGILLYRSGLIGGWILIPGFLRYLFGLSIWIFNATQEQETSSKTGKYIAGFMFVSLPLPYLIPVKIASIILMIASAAIVYSFGRSAYFLKVKKPQ